MRVTEPHARLESAAEHAAATIPAPPLARSRARGDLPICAARFVDLPGVNEPNRGALPSRHPQQPQTIPSPPRRDQRLATPTKLEASAPATLAPFHTQGGASVGAGFSGFGANSAIGSSSRMNESYCVCTAPLLHLYSSPTEPSPTRLTERIRRWGESSSRVSLRARYHSARSQRNGGESIGR